LSRLKSACKNGENFSFPLLENSFNEIESKIYVS
jgi:hypothetical protein